MYNLLIIYDDYNFINQLSNIILKNQEINLIYKSTDRNKMTKYIKQGLIDIIILESTTDNYIEVLDKLNEIKKSIFIPKIFIITSNINSNDSLTMFEFINKTLNICDISSQILESTLKYGMEIENNKKYIISELQYIGYNFKYLGTLYLLESILLICTNNNFYLINNLEKNVYSRIAKKYFKSVSNIKSDICKSNDLMYAQTNCDILLEYFHFTYDTKPTPKLVMSTILNKLNCNNYNFV